MIESGTGDCAVRTSFHIDKIQYRRKVCDIDTDLVRDRSLDTFIIHKESQF